MWDGSGSGLVIRDISPPGETVRFVTGASREAASVQADRVADALIPDNDPKGIASGLLISPSGKLTKIEVEVHITHSYVSDLQVELVAPGGRQAMLHDRMGGSGDDLLETFTSSSPGSLQGLAGVEIAGEWRLLVRDLAGQDQGRLNSWGLALEYEPSGEEIRAEATPGLDIPDNDPEGAMSRMEIEASGSLLEPVVGVDVRHTFVGDLLLELIAPGGETAVLHSRSGGGQNNLNMSYDLGNTQSLQALVGTEIKGVWRLRVRDMARFDEGRLERWSLQLRYR
jgi:subtilisin-like proprotein convertase family protein